MKKFSTKILYSIITIELMLCGLLYFHISNAFNIKLISITKPISVVNNKSGSIILTNSGQVKQGLVLRQVEGLPLRLKIPVIHIDALIEPLGLTSDGTMKVPSELANVGWYNGGTIPGKKGSAVMGGHHGIKSNIGVFYDITKLHKGDLLYVENDKGETIIFVVREGHVYDFEIDAKKIFTSISGTHLNLITCVGNRSKIKKIYTQRFIVFTDMVVE